MRITVVTFQKSRNADLERAEAEYIKRLQPHATVQIEPLRTWDDRTLLPARLLRSTWRIGLFVDGTSFDSAGMAARLQALMNQGQSHLVVVIGAADGMPPGVAAQLDERWSLSQLTFGHQLARLILLEALYRSFDILCGGRYHK